MPHSSLYTRGDAAMGASRSSIISVGSRQCLARDCKRSHCKREYTVRGLYRFEYSDYCKDHTCFRDMSNYPSFCHMQATHAGSEVCDDHSTCSVHGCHTHGRNNTPYADQAWYCRSHRCRHESCIDLALSGRKHCASHLICAKQDCPRVPTEKGMFCAHHECSLSKCHQRATDSDRCEQHRVCRVASCNDLAMQDAYHCRSHRCRISICDLQMEKDSKFCIKHCCKIPGCKDSRSQADSSSRTPYCSRHACLASGCAKPAGSVSKYCEELHSCAIPHCHGQRSMANVADNIRGLCTEHYIDQARREVARQSEAQRKRKEQEYEAKTRCQLDEIRRLEDEREAREREKDAQIKKRREEEKWDRAFKFGKQAERERRLKKEEEAKKAELEAQIAREEAERRADAGPVGDDFADMRQEGRHYRRERRSSVLRTSMPTPIIEVGTPEDIYDVEPERYYTTYTTSSRRQQAPRYHDDHSRQSTYYQPTSAVGSVPRRAFSPERVVYGQFPVTPGRSRSFRQRSGRPEDYGVPYVSGSRRRGGGDEHRPRRRDEPLPYPDFEDHHVDRPLRRSETYRY